MEFAVVQHVWDLKLNQIFIQMLKVNEKSTREHEHIKQVICWEKNDPILHIWVDR